VSFFDEDEPVRTTQRTQRPRPRPRRARAAGGSGSAGDSQTVLIRRAVALGAVVVFILLMGILVSSCRSNAAKNALRDYTTEVTRISNASDQTGQQLFKLFGGSGAKQPQQMQSAISNLRAQADTTLKQAQQLSVPGAMTQAQQSLLIALELRRDALESMAEQIRPALGSQSDQSTSAIKSIAGQMRAFDASDVLYQSRVTPFMKKALDDNGIGAQPAPTSNVLKDISWISPTFVGAKLGKQLPGSGNGGASGDGGKKAIAPGLHGTGLNGTSYGSVNLQEGVANDLAYVSGQPFQVSFTNQGENDEVNVKVTVTVVSKSGSPVSGSTVVPAIAQGQTQVAKVTLSHTPPFGTAAQVNVSVAGVPGEKTLSNNKASYPALFTRG